MIDLSLIIIVVIVCLFVTVFFLAAAQVASREDQEMERLYIDLMNKNNAGGEEW